VAFLPRHGSNHGVSPTDLPYRANMYALKKAGVTHIFASNAVEPESGTGARHARRSRSDLRPDEAPRPLLYGDGVVVHQPFADPYSPELVDHLTEAAESAVGGDGEGDTADDTNVVKGGTYVCIEGPQYSTRAESEFYKSQGWDLVGMTAIPEAKLAREAEIAYATIAGVTDYDVWKADSEVTLAEVLENAEQNQKAIKAAVEEAVRTLRTAWSATPTHRSKAPSTRLLKRSRGHPRARRAAAGRLLINRPRGVEHLERLEHPQTSERQRDGNTIIPIHRPYSPMSLSLDADQLDRYSRHVIMDEVGPEGQKRLLDGRALVVGAGGLGAPVIQYLAAAGVGTIRDRRRRRGRALEPPAAGDPRRRRRGRAEGRVGGAVRRPAQSRHRRGDVRDAARRGERPRPARRLRPRRRLRGQLPDSIRCQRRRPDRGASRGPRRDLHKFEGQATTLVPDGPCYRCLFPEAPEPGTVPDCATTGVLGVLPGTVGCIQATEAIKLLLDTGETLDGRVLFYDAMDMTFESVPYRRNPDCPVCGDDGIETIEGIDYSGGCRVDAD